MICKQFLWIFYIGEAGKDFNLVNPTGLAVHGLGLRSITSQKAWKGKRTQNCSDPNARAPGTNLSVVPMYPRNAGWLHYIGACSANGIMEGWQRRRSLSQATHTGCCKLWVVK